MMVLVGLSLSSCNKTPNSEPKAKVNVTVEDKGRDYVVATFTPNKSCIAFEFAIGKASDLAAFDGGTLKGSVVRMGNGELKEYIFEGLEAGTDYIIFARGTTADGENGDIFTEHIKTDVPPELANIAVTTDKIRGHSIDVTFTPDAATVNFKFAIGQESDLTAFNNGTLQSLVDVYNGNVKEYTFENLSVNTEYTIFVSGINSDGVWSETVETKLTTLYTSSVNVHFFSISTSSAEVEITPNELCVRYFFFCMDMNRWYNWVETDEYEEKLDKMIEYVESMGIEQSKYSSRINFGLSGNPDYEYLILILSYDAQDRPVYQEIHFVTPSANNSPRLSSPNIQLPVNKIYYDFVS